MKRGVLLMIIAVICFGIAIYADLNQYSKLFTGAGTFGFWMVGMSIADLLRGRRLNTGVGRLMFILAFLFTFMMLVIYFLFCIDLNNPVIHTRLTIIVICVWLAGLVGIGAIKHHLKKKEKRSGNQ